MCETWLCVTFPVGCRYYIYGSCADGQKQENDSNSWLVLPAARGLLCCCGYPKLAISLNSIQGIWPQRNDADWRTGADWPTSPQDPQTLLSCRCKGRTQLHQHAITPMTGVGAGWIRVNSNYCKLLPCWRQDEMKVWVFFSSLLLWIQTAGQWQKHTDGCREVEAGVVQGFACFLRCFFSKWWPRWMAGPVYFNSTTNCILQTDQALDLKTLISSQVRGSVILDAAEMICYNAITFSQIQATNRSI